MELRNLVHKLCERVIYEKEQLTRIDQAIGDGDFGINMERGCQAVIGCLDKSAGFDSSEDLLKEVAKALNAAGCGTAGTLISAGVLAGAPHSASLVKFLEAAVQKIRTIGRANPGQKTLVDALFPAVEALQKSASLEEASKAAKNGAEATRTMKGTRGRALYSQTRGQGTADPGAWLIAILFDEAFLWRRSLKGSQNEEDH